MQLKIPFKWPLFLVGIAGIALSSLIIFFLTGNTPVESTPRAVFQEHPSLPTAGARAELPIRFIIPKINVDATVEYVGVTSGGAMDVPKGPDAVAWFSLGSRPGETGSAVISGHYGWKNGIPAVFDNLHMLQKGDKLYVEDEKGAITTFVVREFRTYGGTEPAPEVFGSSDGKAHLNLITCTGVWNKTKKSYSQRLVVFADKE